MTVTGGRLREGIATLVGAVRLAQLRGPPIERVQSGPLLALMDRALGSQAVAPSATEGVPQPGRA